MVVVGGGGGGGGGGGVETENLATHIHVQSGAVMSSVHVKTRACLSASTVYL